MQPIVPAIPPGPLAQRARMLLRLALADSRVPAYLWGRITHPYWRWAFHSFGPRSIVQRPAALLGAAKMAIGADCFIFRGSWLAVTGRATGRDEPALRIGDRVRIRPYATIWAGESLVIEDDVNMGMGVVIADSQHNAGVTEGVLGRNPAQTAPTRIRRGAGIGEHAVVLPGSDIGEGAAVGANSVVQGKIPDYAIAAGIPARVIGMTGEGRQANRDRRGIFTQTGPA